MNAAVSRPPQPVRRGNLWRRVFATPTAPHRELGGCEALDALHERAMAWCYRAVALFEKSDRKSNLLAVRYVGGHLAVFARVFDLEDAARILGEVGPLDASVACTWVDRPRLLTPQEQAAWDECGALGLDAAERSRSAWQQVCHPDMRYWLHRAALNSHSWIRGLAIPRSAEEASGLLQDALHLGWVSCAAPDIASRWRKIEELTFQSFKATPLLRRHFGLQTEVAT